MPSTVVGYFKNRQIFTEFQESNLTDYIKKDVDIYYSLTPKGVKRLAYLYAISLHLTVPNSWKKNEMAGPNWFTSFLKRNAELAIRTPEAISLSRATRFNKTNVDRFFSNLEIVLRTISRLLWSSGIWTKQELLQFRDLTELWVGVVSNKWEELLRQNAVHL
ncbi:uncharacterized protein [Leptinotarsa decemlineata]|uniref:uncharacterized protein n=1 Tax=Leptinotarsa decemlineata TaxID=7539 RepID=UPI003D30C3EE